MLGHFFPCLIFIAFFCEGQTVTDTVGNITPETTTEQSIHEVTSRSGKSQPQQQSSSQASNRAAAKGDDSNSSAGPSFPAPPLAWLASQPETAILLSTGDFFITEFELLVLPQ